MAIRCVDCQIEGSEEQDVIKHIDIDRESEALSQTTDTIEWNSAMKWTEAAEENSNRSQVPYDDLGVDLDWYHRFIYRYYHLIDRCHYLRRIARDALSLWCSCKSQ